MTVDLDHLSLKDLRKLDADIGKAITSLEKKQKIEAIAALEQQAKDFGFTLEELFPDRPQRRKRAVSP